MARHPALCERSNVTAAAAIGQLMPLTVRVDLPSRDRQVLTSWACSPSVRPGLAQRARIVLLAADGARTSEIVARTGASKPTVIAWKKRYAVEGLRGLQDRRKPGRPRHTDDAAIVLATLAPPPPRPGVTHWSSRLLAGELGVSYVKVAATWRELGLQPWRREPFRFATQPRLDISARDVTGLYLSPPDYAVVLDGTGSPARPDGPADQADENAGAVALLAALTSAATQDVAGTYYPRRRHRKFLHFLQQAAAARPDAVLHVVAVDSYATRRHPDVRAWLARHPRITPHFTATHRSWLTMTEVFVTLSSPSAGGSPPALPGTLGVSAAIGAVLTGWTDGSQPFAWTKPADADEPGGVRGQSRRPSWTALATASSCERAPSLARIERTCVRTVA